VTELFKFSSWNDVLAYAHGGGPLYYQAPMDARPTKLNQCYKHVARQPCAPYTYAVRGKTIRIFPPGSNRRPSDPDRADPFTADKGHLDRFSAPEEKMLGDDSFSRENPAGMSNAEMIGLGVLGLVVVGGIGYWLYTRAQASSTAAQASAAQALPTAAGSATLPPTPGVTDNTDPVPPFVSGF